VYNQVAPQQQGTARLAAIMPRIDVDKQTGIHHAIKSTWINGA
jgi:hypothetical protein